MYQGKYSQDPQPQAPVRRNRNRRKNKGKTVFYSIYFGSILLFFVALFVAMGPLKAWLTEYEASQPNHARDQVFQQLFQSRDWQGLYEKAGEMDTAFEGAAEFAAFMEARVGQQELQCLETSAGLSGDKKFIVKAGDEKIATFTLTGGSDSQLAIANWELGSLELFYTRQEQVQVEKFPGQTVYINGIPLDDTYTVRVTTTLAESYLTDGLQGYRQELVQVQGLLCQPKVEVKNADGTAAALTFDAETGTYTQQLATMEPTDTQKELAKNAMEAYGKFMVGKADRTEVAKWFEKGSDAYKTISSSETNWVQSFSSYRFTEPVFSAFYQYSEDCFSIMVEMALEVTRGNGSIKEFPMHNTLIIEKNSAGNFTVTQMTNVDIQQEKSQVRLTFCCDGEIVSSVMVDQDAKKLTLPTVPVPEGKVFKGWAVEEQDETGKTVWTVMFDAMGDVSLSGTLEPMELTALFGTEEQ